LSLIAELKDIEIKCGRIKRDKWFEREIDIDILFFDDIILKSELLEIPHPQMQNRRFVLVPLNEIEPDFIHPLLNVNMRTLLETGIDKSEVKLYKDKI
jgi:2-amino-4-hydroxy-6-hydroxymethyldihydropteridine diphosphokinase